MAETASSRRRKKKKARRKEEEKTPPWDAVWEILNCKKRHTDVSRVRTRRVVCSRLVQRHVAPSPEPVNNLAANSSLSSSSSLRVLHLRRLSGCYECQTAADPINGVFRNPNLRIISPCPDCDEIFFNPESLHLHQIEKHAVMELGPEDGSRNIVEIIFQSSWMKKGSAACKIERILKIKNSKKTITRFEEYRDSVKSRAKRNPRCAADGNELLRFRCSAAACELGAVAAAGLCSVAGCGRAHDVAAAEGGAGGVRAMLVCRVIAGRVRKSQEVLGEEFDSVGGGGGGFKTVDELVVFNARAILPCFVVIYSGF